MRLANVTIVPRGINHACISCRLTLSISRNAGGLRRGMSELTTCGRGGNRWWASVSFLSHVHLTFLQEVLAREVHAVQKVCLVVQERQKLIRHGVKLVLMFEKRRDHTYGAEAIVPNCIATSCIQDARTDDGRQVLKVHLTSGFLVHVRKRGHPFEKDEEDLHRVSVTLWQDQ
jgi:hypothetical protein